ncbi:exodeoxyribonuclease VII large subunit [Granulibacter bethesdensis]|uniref:Exodeoxyribonuclease 7 large subunit n=1 Tax=Granulibacter bethesdensis (strain ATCC BAA-1260 / CGDNIH1) TaxID=391165 RepID=Q0BPQ6_GRABC|nr:exodeoxyribonuclease VII large subunit [Granulibacter bethesdensis]ABI63196.1 Exodeoxyribonuclease VII large subunit [Granulibacter bethesdensis CGDNIH1]AHJ67831.1 Exodeoxyribonuclease VII large subunit [Granulibacter bethesdensis]APH53074.1 Exodeoxyribonuclease VII large subunit [Granulibacter bethesdensis]APH65763.1 Exodeoxyribonuclease VII large subunit [Granulibacter bethesdensis]
MDDSSNPHTTQETSAGVSGSRGLDNIPEYSVSDLSGTIKRTLEGAFGRVRVRGELTEVKRYPSGHIYLSLKDEGGKIAGVVWKFAVPRLGMLPENGVEVVATGKISSYADRSSYQLIIDRMEYAGAGALLARIEMLRQRLAEEGLFDAARKRALPRLPRVVGVVSSEKGAVLQDIRTTIARRFPRTVLLWPVPVQGEGAAAKIAAAIDGFGRLPPDGPVPRPDVLIVARGGGSLEDLMAFNEEIVIRAAAACPIPVISAVGHETDTTLIDYASDRRAPTPTAAAELAVPMRAELTADLAHKTARLGGALSRMTQGAWLGLAQAERLLPDLPTLLGHARQRLDDRSLRLGMALPGLLAARRAGLRNAALRLPRPAHIITQTRQHLRGAENSLRVAMPMLLAHKRSALRLHALRLGASLRHSLHLHLGDARPLFVRMRAAPLPGRLREAQARLDGLCARLESVSYQAVLARGYALVLDHDGHAVTQAARIASGQILTLRFSDGEKTVQATHNPAGSTPPAGNDTASVKRTARKKSGPQKQGDLLL